jgi:hypothetical protein
MPIDDLRRTTGDKGHSSKPTTHYGIEGEKIRLSGPITRRQRALFPGQRIPHMHLPPTWNGDKRRYATYMRKLKEWKKANGQGGGRTRRSTRRG